MALRLSFRSLDDYLLIEGDGHWQLDDVERKIEIVRHEAQERGHQRILIDIRNIAPPSREIERFFAGERLAMVWGHSLKAAIVWSQETLTRIGENAAVNRGANMRTFADPDQAVQWLLQDP